MEFVAVGAMVDLELLLFGPAATESARFLEALSVMVRQGIGRGRGKARIEDEQQSFERAVEGPFPAHSFFRGRLLRTSTPVHIKVDGQFLSDPNASELVRAAVRRLVGLAWTFGPPGSTLAAISRALLEAGRNLEGACERIAGRWKRVRITRWSERQRAHHPLEGVIGEVVLEGLPDWALWALKCAEPYGIGKGPSLGMGRFEIAEAHG